MPAAPGAGEEARQGEGKRAFTFPSAYTILFLLLIIVTFLTWIIPAGRYDYASDGSPIPGTYHTVPQNPLRIVEGALLGPVDGMYGLKDSEGLVSASGSGTLYGAINVALFVLVIGGFLGLTMKTGAIDAGIGAAVRGLGARGTWLIPILMVLFALGGTSYGMAEESLAFYVLVIAAIIALGFDALTGVAVVMLGAGIGVLGSTVNPFATGIASGFAGIPLTEGIAYRLVLLVLGLGLGIFFVMRYAQTRREGRHAVARLRAEGGERAVLPRPRRGAGDAGAHRPAEDHPGPVRAGLPGHDLQRHPVERPGHHGPADAGLVVPAADRAVPPLRHHHRLRRPDGRAGADRRASWTGRATCWASRWWWGWRGASRW